MSAVLVTGGAGAIGSNLVARLLDRGHEVVVIDDLSSGRRALVPEGARFVEGSICDDRVLSEAFAAKPEQVFHLAALFANQNSVEHPQRDIEVNGLGTVKVLEWAARTGVGRLVFSSSSCVYGSCTAMREDVATSSTHTPYAITKMLGEHYCRFWSSYHQLDTAIVRLFNVYGPNDFPGRFRGVIPNFFRRALDGKALVVMSTGEETRDFTFIDDAVDGILAVATCGGRMSGDVFNVGSGVATTIRTVAERINAMTGNGAGIESRPGRDWDCVAHRVADIAKSSTSVGYRATVTLEEGLGRTLAWFRSHEPQERHRSPAGASVLQ